VGILLDQKISNPWLLDDTSGYRKAELYKPLAIFDLAPYVWYGLSMQESIGKLGNYVATEAF